MHSGDVGYLDAAGRLFVVGRDDEMVVSDGANVYPIEVEKTLASHLVVPSPRSITVLTSLPRGSMGKISRRDLQELLEKDGGDDQAP